MGDERRTVLGLLYRCRVDLERVAYAWPPGKRTDERYATIRMAAKRYILLRRLNRRLGNDVPPGCRISRHRQFLRPKERP